jgi:4-amino-4-deoxy-L-arabinose transferase-like glycosyltransferase
MEAAVPDFLRYVTIVESWQRATSGALQRTGPFWYYPPFLLSGAFPWSVALLAGLVWRRRPKDRGRTDHRAVFLGLWILVPLVLFTLSQSKRPQYILPLLPALAIATGALWEGGEERWRVARAAAIVALAGFGVAMLAAARWAIPPGHLIPGLAPYVPSTAVAVGAVSLLAAVLAGAAGGRRWVALALALPVVALPTTIAPALKEVARQRSAQELAQRLVPQVEGGAALVGLDVYSPSLSFYLGQPMQLVVDPHALPSNYLRQTYDAWRRSPGSPLRERDWWERALADCERPWIFVIRSSDDGLRAALETRLPLLHDSGRLAAYGPCGGGQPAALPERAL